MYNIINIIILVVAVLSIIYNIKTGIYWYVFTKLFWGNSQSYLDTSFNPLPVILFLLLLFYLIDFFTHGSQNKNKIPRIYIFIFFIFLVNYFISTLHSPDFAWSFNTAFLDLFARIIFLLIMLKYFNKLNDYKYIISILMIYNLTNASLLLLQKITGVSILRDIIYISGFQRFSALSGDPNMVGLSFCALIPFIFYFVFINKRSKLLILIYLAAGIVVIIVTVSKSTLILFFFSIIISLTLLTKSITKQIVIIASVIILFTLLYYIFFDMLNSLPIYQRLMIEINPHQADTLEWRFIKWGIAFEEFLKSPFVGMGPEMFVMSFYTFSYYIHNSYLDILVESGLISFIPLLLLLSVINYHNILIIKKTSNYFYYSNYLMLIIFLIGYGALSGGFLREMQIYLSFTITIFGYREIIITKSNEL